MPIKIGEADDGSAIKTYMVSEIIAKLQAFPQHLPCMVEFVSLGDNGEPENESLATLILDVTDSPPEPGNPDSLHTISILAAIPPDDDEDDDDTENDEENDDNENEEDDSELSDEDLEEAESELEDDESDDDESSDLDEDEDDDDDES